MSEINNTEQLRLWFRGCPALLRSNRLRVDYLSEKPDEYSINAVPSTLRTHENILGEEVLDDIQTENFIFASRSPYGADIQQNLMNLAFFQSVMTWILEKNTAREFPQWNGGRVKSIMPTLTAYPAQIGTNAAKYQIQLKVTYRRV